MIRPRLIAAIVLVAVAAMLMSWVGLILGVALWTYSEWKAGSFAFREIFRFPKVDQPIAIGFGLSVLGNLSLIGVSTLIVGILSAIAPPLILRLNQFLEQSQADAWTLVITMPVIEEFIFRGLLLGALKRRYGLRAAVIGSAVIFGILHVEFLSGFGFGLLAGLLVARTGSIWLPILLHVIDSGMVLLVEKALPAGAQNPTSIEMVKGSAIELALYGVALMVAGAPFLFQAFKRGWPSLELSRSAASTEPA